MSFRILKIDGWEWVKEMALTTIHKDSIEGKEITPEWKLNMLMSRHSPIRELHIRIKTKQMKRWVADQLVRHSVGVNNGMGTMREDRGNKNRSEQTMEDLTMLYQSHNAESFINMMETRLCVGCVSRETRQICEALRDEVEKTEQELAFMCVPNCVKLGGCKESFVQCSYFKNFITDVPLVYLVDLKSRYELYHDWRKK
jgi:hypothetical protein